MSRGALATEPRPRLAAGLRKPRGCNQPLPSTVVPSKKPIALFQLLGEEGEALTTKAPDIKGAFMYSPSEEVLAVGQEIEFRPEAQAGDVPLRYRLAQPAPAALRLRLDPVSGVVNVTAIEAMPQRSVLILADLPQKGSVVAVLSLEVVDFSCGGYVAGHLSEVEPGCFMMLLHIPAAPGKDPEAKKEAGSSSTASTVFERNVSGDSWENSSLPGCPPARGALVDIKGGPAAAVEATAPPRGVDVGGGGAAERDPMIARTPSSWSSNSLAADAAAIAPRQSAADEQPRAGRLLATSPVQPQHVPTAAKSSAAGQAGRAGKVLSLEDALTAPSRPSGRGEEQENEDPPNAGSTSHYLGDCKPCAFFYKQGCQGGVDCSFCHLCGPGELRKRKNEKKKANKKARRLYGPPLPGP